MKCAPVSSAAYSRDARNRHLDHHGGNRGQDQHEQTAHGSTAAIIAIAHPAEVGAVAQPGDGAGDGSGHRTDQDVAIVYVSQFVGQHAFEFFVVEQAQDALRDRNRGVLWIASGGECVR